MATTPQINGRVFIAIHYGFVRRFYPAAIIVGHRTGRFAGSFSI